MNPLARAITLIPFLLAAAALPVNSSVPEQGWIDELKDTVLFYQQKGPETALQPYLDKLTSMRLAIAEHDDATLQAAQGEFIRMLALREYGINDVAADDLFQMFTSRDIGALDEVTTSPSDTSLNTPFDGGPRCAFGGCDYWKDDVFDAGAG